MRGLKGSGSVKTLRGVLVTGVALALAAPLAVGGVVAANAGQDDGRRGFAMAWSRFVDRDFSSAAIVLRSPDGEIRVLTRPPAGAVDVDPSFSPDGTRVLFERDYPDGAVGIGLVRTDGTGERILDLGCEDPCAGDLVPSWYPDGRHIVFTRVSGIDVEVDAAASAVLWVSDLHGRRITRLSEPGIDGRYEDYGATFAPGGYVVFTRLRGKEGGGVEGAAFRMAPDGTQVRRLTPWAIDADMVKVSPAASGPSEDLVVFETFGHGAPEGTSQAIGTVPATCRPVSECRDRIRLLTPAHSRPVERFNPSWSPDGRRIAFVRFEDHGDSGVTGDIWVMRWNGSHKRALSASPLFEFRPSWGVVAPSD